MQYITKMCFLQVFTQCFFTSIPQELLQSPDFQREFKYADPETKKIDSNETVCRILVLNLETDSDMIPSAAEQNQLFLC